MPLHKARFSRTVFLGFGSWAAVGDPSDSKMTKDATPLMRPPFAIHSISNLPTLGTRAHPITLARSRCCPDMAARVREMGFRLIGSPSTLDRYSNWAWDRLFVGVA